MRIVAVILLGLATNLDNLCVGLAYGLGKKKITFGYNLLIALFSFVFTLICSYPTSLAADMGSLPNLIGGALLIVFGVFSLLPVIRKKEDAPQVREINFRQFCILGSAMAVNCIPAAIGVGMSGMAPLPASISVCAFSCILVGMGNHIGLKAAGRFNCDALTVISAVLMMVLGLLELLF